MGFQKVPRHDMARQCQQALEIAQAPGAVMRGNTGRIFQVDGGVFPGWVQQALHHAQTLWAARLLHRFGPGARQRSNQAATPQQIIGTPFDDVPFAAVQVSGIGGELSRLGQRVQGDRFPARVVNAQPPVLLPHPDLAADVFGRGRVIGLLELHITIALHPAQRVLEPREQTRRQRLQGRAFHGFKEFAHLLADRAVNARVGHVLFPVRKMTVVRRQTGKAPALDRVVLRILYARLHFPLVPGHDRLGGQNDRAVMPGKLRQLGMELRIVPVGLEHPGFQVVGHHRGRNPAKVPEGIFQTPDKALGGLAPNPLTVALARMTQPRTKQMRPAPLPVRQHPGPLTKINLHLLARRAFHPAKRQLRPGRPLAHEAFHRIIPAGERVPGDQILINALGRKSCPPTLRDHGGQRSTLAGSPRFGPGGHRGRFCRRSGRRAGGRNGRF